jgi:hypothetical protein
MFNLPDLDKNREDYIIKNSNIEYFYDELTEKENIPINKGSLYYLFDGDIDDNIGSSYIYIYNLFIVLGVFFDVLNDDNIIPVNHPTHATLFYKIDLPNENRYYIYYSNSGLGINNHLIIDDCIIPKIYVTNDKNIRDCAIEIINIIYDLMYKFNNKEHNKKFKIYMKGRLYQDNETMIKQYFDFIKDETNKINEKYNIKCDYVIGEYNDKFKKISDDSKLSQDIIYAIINFVINKLNANNYEINECTTNHIIVGNEPTELLDVFKELYHKENSNLSYFLENIYNEYNTTIYKKIKAIDKSKFSINKKIINMNLLVTKINNELQKYKSLDKTIEYKLTKFKLTHTNFYGLGNNKQRSGSCSFYSFYNLYINMIIINQLHNVDIDTSTSTFVDIFLNIHYAFVNLLIYELLHIREYKKFYINNNYIYKLLIKNNLYDTIIKNNKFIQFEKKYGNINDMLIDKFTLYNKIKQKSIIYKTDDIQLYSELKNYINEIIYRIRISDKTITDDYIKNTVKHIMINKLKMFTQEFIKEKNIINHNTTKSNIFLILVDVYVIILLILNKIYVNYNNNIDYPYHCSKTEFAQRNKIIIDDSKIKYNNELECESIKNKQIENIYYLYINLEFDDIHKIKLDEEEIKYNKYLSLLDGENFNYFCNTSKSDIFFYDLIYSRLKYEEILYLSNFFIDNRDNSIISITNILNIINYNSEYIKYLYVYIFDQYKFESNKFINLDLTMYFKEPTTNYNYINKENYEISDIKLLYLLFIKYISCKQNINNTCDNIKYKYIKIKENIVLLSRKILLSFMKNNYKEFLNKILKIEKYK